MDKMRLSEFWKIVVKSEIIEFICIFDMKLMKMK